MVKLAPQLSIVATPIGNLQDMPPRNIEALKQADIIACEDTRRAKILLTHFGITGKRMLAHHSANEAKSTPGLIKLIHQGHSMAYISDGGLPTISDPGYLLVKAAVEAGIDVSAVGGTTAVTLAVALSGLPASRFLFAGFLPRQTKAQTQYFEDFLQQNLATALVFYESPHRIIKTLQTLEKIAPNAPIAFCRELTKTHEETLRGTVAEVSHILAQRAEIKGELTLVLAKR